MNGRRPRQAGSSLGIDPRYGYGTYKEGRYRPYSTAPTDLWWVNQPHEGFQSRAAQIMTHEINNEIQAKIETDPYNCPPLLATDGAPAAQYEAERLTKLDEACCQRLGDNDGGR